MSYNPLDSINIEIESLCQRHKQICDQFGKDSQEAKDFKHMYQSTFNLLFDERHYVEMKQAKKQGEKLQKEWKAALDDFNKID